MYEAIYFEICVISCIIVLLILVRNKRNNDRQAAILAYNRVLMATVVVLLLDAAWTRLENQPGRVYVLLNNLVNAWYLFQSCLIGYLWLQFVLCRLRKNLGQSRFVRLSIALPLWIIFVMCALSPWTHWLFRITPDNVYERGTLIIVQIVFSYGYMVAAGLYALYCAGRAKDRTRRSEAATLSSFIVLPAIGGVTNTLVYGLPLLWPLTVVSLLMVYMNLQNQQISTDELTGLNNRRQFDRYLLAQTEDKRRDERLYLLLIDVDSFKKINDTYGHLTGDRALTQTAKVLRGVCGVWQCFLARYGGDEFAIVFKTREPMELGRLKNDIHAAFERFNATAAMPYTLSVSVGAGVFTQDATGPADLIALADQALYEVKTEKKESGTDTRTA